MYKEEISMPYEFDKSKLRNGVWKIEDLNTEERLYAEEQGCDSESYWKWFITGSDYLVAIRAFKCPVCQEWVYRNNDNNCEHLSFIYEAINEEYIYDKVGFEELLLQRFQASIDYSEFNSTLETCKTEEEIAKEKRSIAEIDLPSFIDEIDEIKTLVGDITIFEDFDNSSESSTIYGFLGI
jgi:hypothetical protein